MIKIEKPVRQIGVTNRSVSGIVPNIGRYESSLERDLMERLRFDHLVESVVPQPLTLPFMRKDGSSGEYTPDGLITFKAPTIELPILYEVKYRKDFRESWKVLLPKFRAAKDLCQERGWEFRVFTEREIRTPYLKNVKFLWGYSRRSVSTETMRWVYQVLLDLDEADPDFLVHSLCRDKNNRAEILPVIWYMISKGHISCDLEQELTMNSKIWPSGADL